jgi:hypothetical protein
VFCHPQDLFKVVIALDSFLREVTSETFKFAVVINPERLAVGAPCDEVDVGTQGFLFCFHFELFHLQRRVLLYPICNLEELFGSTGVHLFEVTQGMVREV